MANAISRYPVNNPILGVGFSVPAWKLTGKPLDVYDPGSEVTQADMDAAAEEHQLFVQAVISRGVPTFVAGLPGEPLEFNSYPLHRLDHHRTNDFIFRMDSSYAAVFDGTARAFEAHMIRDRRDEGVTATNLALEMFSALGHSEPRPHYIPPGFSGQLEFGLEFGDLVRVGDNIIMGQSFNDHNGLGRTLAKGWAYFQSLINRASRGKLPVHKVTFAHAFHLSTGFTFWGWDKDGKPVVGGTERWVKDFSAFDKIGVRFVPVHEEEDYAGNALHLQPPDGRPFLLAGDHHERTLELMRRTLHSEIELVPVKYKTLETKFKSGPTCLARTIDVFNLE